jgi:hypothetical protein
MSMEPAMGLREIAQSARMWISLGQGSLERLTEAAEETHQDTVWRLCDLLKISAEEARAMIVDGMSKDAMDRYVEARRAILKPNWEAEM